MESSSQNESTRRDSVRSQTAAAPSLTGRIFSRGLELLRRLRRGSASLGYWEARARSLGVRSVLNLRHTEAEIESVTAMQERILFPLLQERLRPDDRRVLDFGCGPGRFTPG